MTCKVIILYLIFFSGLYACSQNNKVKKAENDRMEAFNTYLNEMKMDKEAIRLKDHLRDSIQSWISKELDYAYFLGKTKWKIDDAVFFDEQKQKALLFILFQPDDPDWLYDYSKVVAAEKINEAWNFYYASYPLFLSNRNNGQPVNFDSLSKDARWQLISDGFISCDRHCRVNYKYVDSDVWFTDWRREMHQRFLKNEMPENPIEDNKSIPH